MELASAVSEITDVPRERVMLLRHSNSTVRQLLSQGGTVEEYTSVQPTGSKYDFLNPKEIPVEAIAVVVDDRVCGVYKVLGVETEGTTFSLTSPGHRRFEEARGMSEMPARRFMLQRVYSQLDNALVSGWEGRGRTAVQRSRNGFFAEIEVQASLTDRSPENLQAELEQAVQTALRRTPAAREARLRKFPRLPVRVEVVGSAFIRNPDVIAEVLLRAAGVCELCRMAAPFNRRSDHTPYLEVHHRVTLASGGEDTVENAIAICPNCHRREHFG